MFLNVNPTLFKIFCAFLTVWLIKHLFNFINRLRKLPPGPWGLPFVGYLPFIKKDSYIQMTELAKKYGPVFSFKCGQFDVIVINEVKAIEEALKNDHLLARPASTYVPGLKRDPSLIEMSGEPWRQQRRVALTILRNVGLGKSTLEVKIKEEIGYFIDSLKSAHGNEVDFGDEIKTSVSNNISILLFGHRFVVRTWTCFSIILTLCKLPPGPWGLPFVGYLPFIKKDAYIHMTELGKKYGPVFSFKCGQCDVVVINEVKAIEEAFKNDHLTARPTTTFIPGFKRSSSLLEMSGEPWRQQRRVALTILRNVGLGKSTLEVKIKEEIGYFIDSLKSAHGNEVDFGDEIKTSVSNNISILLFGHRFEYNDPIGSEMRRNMKQVIENVPYFSKFMFMPVMLVFVSLVAHFSSDLRKMTSNQKELEKKVTKEVAKHREKQTTHEIEDYIDGFLQEMDKQKDSNTSFNINTLRRNTSDFYAAGSDTTTHVLNFMMLYLVTYPEHQQKIRDEIKQTIGFERQPDYADRTWMPFRMAFIYESLRMSTIVPLNVHRRAAQDTKVMSYSIPKDTIVILNFWAVHRDPNLWNDPHSFKPERFLSEDGQKVIKSPNLMPFSGGKRICPGATLALIELFLYLVSIVQNFQVSVPERDEIHDEAKYAFLRMVKKPVKLNFHTLKEN